MVNGQHNRGDDFGSFEEAGRVRSQMRWRMSYLNGLFLFKEERMRE